MCSEPRRPESLTPRGKPANQELEPVGCRFKTGNMLCVRRVVMISVLKQLLHGGPNLCVHKICPRRRRLIA